MGPSIEGFGGQRTASCFRHYFDIDIHTPQTLFFYQLRLGRFALTTYSDFEAKPNPKPGKFRPLQAQLIGYFVGSNL